MQLQNLQSEFAEMLLNNDNHCDFISPAKHLTIYRNNFLTTLIQNLKETYPLICQLLGEDFFEVIAKHYIAQYPSISGDLHEYGEYLSDFLQENESVQHLFYLSEVAQFEWICHRIYFAAEHQGLDLASLSSIDPDDYEHLHLYLHPACAIKHFQYPILEIIEMCVQHKEEILNLENIDTYLLIKRTHAQIKLEKLLHADFVFLHAIHNDLSLTDALNQALLHDPNFDLETKLPQWVASHVIVEADLIQDN